MATATDTCLHTGTLSVWHETFVCVEVRNGQVVRTLVDDQSTGEAVRVSCDDCGHELDPGENAATEAVAATQDQSWPEWEVGIG